MNTALLQHHLSKTTLPETIKIRLKNILYNDQRRQRVYEDASKNEEGVSMNIIKINLRYTNYPVYVCSMYTAEAIAILIAIRTIGKRG